MSNSFKLCPTHFSRGAKNLFALLRACGHVYVKWLGITALQADITSDDMLPQIEVFINSRHIPSEARYSKYSHYAKIKEVIAPLFLMIFFY